MRNVDVAIIGAGHAGLNALKEIRKVTDNWVLINGGELGTTCARVGCMPSKAIIELASQTALVNPDGSTDKSLIPELLEKVRDYRDIFVDLILANTTDNMIENKELINGYAQFIAPDTLQVNDEKITAKRIIVATGSQPVMPESWYQFRDRLLNSETLFDLESLPNSVGIIGLGYIGLEMGQALHKLGVKVTGFGHQENIASIRDPKINKEAINIVSRQFPIHLGHHANLAEESDGIKIQAGEVDIKVDKVFVSIGRRPNIPKGLTDFCEVNSAGFLAYNQHTFQLDNLPIFIAGDATGERMKLQDAAEEGKQAGINACRTTPVRARPQPDFSIAFTDPNICAVGKQLDELSHPVIGEQRFGPIGRALIMGSNRGLIRLYADPVNGRLIGAAMVGPRVEHLAHLVAWSIQQVMTIEEMLKMPFYHPVIEEALQDALKNTAKKLRERKPLEGQCKYITGSQPEFVQESPF
ncbi:MAG: dihydrolipoyl dehydrogenase [gamma proteobacterium symbiont of Taylorina sp.]|nr:dihydrolipoyl dehydrogenase [gamma proteobacterium symbiont of Taylorina sp.]